MHIENKNPLLSGLLNVVVPGSSQLYVNRDWSRFIGTFIAGAVAVVVAFYVGNLFQTARGYALPQGMCTGIILMTIVLVLFLSGHKTAKDRNAHLNNVAYYNSKRTVSHESHEKQHDHIQHMRDEGLISGREFEEKNAKIDANNENKQ